MFVQIITGEVADADQLMSHMERWREELLPGAAGFLGSTIGVTDDGTAVTIARFESEQAARDNSSRSEQGHWWAETESCYRESPAFQESGEVEEILGGGSDDAGFVQIMRGQADRSRVGELDRMLAEHAGDMRPDLIGGVRAWVGPDAYVETMYFTSEEEARQGEQSDMPAEIQEAMQQYGDLFEGIEYLDLRQVWTISP
jgi:hypothetical protein